MELNIVAAEEKLGQEAYAFGSLLPNRHQHLYLYGYHKIQKISHKSFLLRQNIKNIIKHILDHPNETELHGISAVRATVILRVKSFWKQVKPSWWDHFCNLVGWKSERISKLCAKSPLFKIEFDSPKNKLELLWKMFQTDLKPQDRSVIAHHICETWLAETTAETTHDKFFIYMTDNILQNQQLLAYALTIDRYRLILVQHEGVADLRELPPTSGLQRAIDLMHANEDVFIQNKMPIITSLLKQEQPRIPEESSAFVRHHLGDEGGTAALSDEEDELAAGAGAAGAAFQGRRQPAQASDDPHISLLARSPSPH